MNCVPTGKKEQDSRSGKGKGRLYFSCYKRAKMKQKSSSGLFITLYTKAAITKKETQGTFTHRSQFTHTIAQQAQ